jgi:hypothetical protein
MDSVRFDRLTRSVSTVLSRRTLAGALGLGALVRPDLADAKKHKKRKKKKIKRNDFGCVNVGGFCKNSGQCCSGICSGKKDKKKCQAHDASTCQVGQTFTQCGGAENVGCTSTGGNTDSTCVTTTGTAAYCAGAATCAPCKTDADCEAVCGAGAACFPCAAECPDDGGTACAGRSEDSCGAMP